MNIAVIGIGGVGGYFGGKLTQLLQDKTKKHEVCFIARNRHLEEIRKNGLILDSDEGEFVCRPTLATDSIEELPQKLDLCLICVKSYDLVNVLPRLQPKIGDHTMILPLLNGVDIYERIRTTIKNGIVFPACIYVGTHIEKAGRVRQRGGACIIHFGKDPRNGAGDPAIFNILEQANIRYNWTGNPYTEIWTKFMFVAPFAMVTAAYNLTIGGVAKSEETARITRRIMEEIHQIALKKGVPLSPTIVEEVFVKADTFPFSTKTSFQRDYVTPGKQDERDLFGGTVIRLGRELGTDTSTTEKVYTLITKQ